MLEVGALALEVKPSLLYSSQHLWSSRRHADRHAHSPLYLYGHKDRGQTDKAADSVDDIEWYA